MLLRCVMSVVVLLAMASGSEATRKRNPNVLLDFGTTTQLSMPNPHRTKSAERLKKLFAKSFSDYAKSAANPPAYIPPGSVSPFINPSQLTSVEQVRMRLALVAKSAKSSGSPFTKIRYCWYRRLAIGGSQQKLWQRHWSQDSAFELNNYALRARAAEHRNINFASGFEPPRPKSTVKKPPPANAVLKPCKDKRTGL